MTTILENYSRDPFPAPSFVCDLREVLRKAGVWITYKPMKFTKRQMARIEALMRKYGINKNEAARMYVRSGF